MKTGIDRVAAIVKGLNQLQNRINIIKNYKISPAVVKGDTGKLHQVFLTILSNAYQTIESKGLITVVVDACGRKIRIKITDDGCGTASD